MPEIAALIYRCKFKDGKLNKDLSLDYTGNYCAMMGYDDKAFQDLMRLYLVIHSVRIGLLRPAEACFIGDTEQNKLETSSRFYTRFVFFFWGGGRGRENYTRAA